jgi:hypothetical protein
VTIGQLEGCELGKGETVSDPALEVIVVISRYRVGDDISSQCDDISVSNHPIYAIGRFGNHPIAILGDIGGLETPPITYIGWLGTPPIAYIGWLEPPPMAYIGWLETPPILPPITSTTTSTRFTQTAINTA